MSTAEVEMVPAADSDMGQDELYIVHDGVRVAKRGRPNRPQAGTWVSIEPGFTVRDGRDGTLVIERNGVKLQ